MGTLLSSSKREDLSLSQEALSALLSNYNLPLPLPQNGIETYYVEYQTQDKGSSTNGTGMIVLLEGKTEAPVLIWLHPTMGFTRQLLSNGNRRHRRSVSRHSCFTRLYRCGSRLHRHARMDWSIGQSPRLHPQKQPPFSRLIHYGLSRTF